MIWYKSGMGDPNLIPSNIKKGVSIFGRLGTFEGWVPSTYDIYKNGSWGSGYSSSLFVNCTGVYSQDNITANNVVFNTAVIDYYFRGYSDGSYAVNGVRGINKNINFAQYNTIKVVTTRGYSNHAKIIVASNWNTAVHSYRGSLVTSDLNILKSQSLTIGGTTTLDVSDISTDAYIYITYWSSDATEPLEISRIYFT